MNLRLVAKQVVLISLAYFFGAKLGFALTFQPTPIAVLWPPNAILTASLLLISPRHWGIVVSALLPVHILVELESHIPLLTILGWYGTNCIEAICSAGLILWLVQTRQIFDTLRGMFIFFMVAVVGSPLVTSFLDAGVVTLTGVGTNYWQLTQARFLSNALAALMFVPAIMLVVQQGKGWVTTATPGKIVEASLLMIVLAGYCFFTFGAEFFWTSSTQLLICTPLPPLLWAAVRFGPGGLSLSLLSTCVVAIWCAAHGIGPFTHQNPYENAASLQMFIVFYAAPLLFLAALITERQTNLEALHTSQTQAQRIFESNLIGIVFLDGDGKVIDANDTFLQTAGYWRKDLFAGKLQWTTLTPESYHQLDQLALDEARMYGVSRTYEKELITGENRRVPVLVRLAFLEKQATVSVGFVLDITEQTQASAKLEQLEDQFVKAFRSSPVVLVISRVSDGKILEINDRFEALLGYSRAQVIGKTSTELNLYDLELRPVLLKQLDEQGYLRDYELDLRDRWGNTVHTSVSFEQISINQEACLLICVQDQTELKKADVALQELTARLLRLQDEERRRIARELHDVTAQNIGAISLNLAYLQKCVRGDDERPVRMIEESIELAEQALKEIRTLSYVLHPPLLDQSGLVPALQWYIDGFCRRSGVVVNLNVAADLERLDTETETTLFRIVQEALTNVYRHSGSASAKIRLQREGNFIKLQIKDHGKGISFHEASAEPQLLGVGIPGMRQRIRQIGGQLEIVSSPKGTVVTAIVPITRK